MVNDNARHTPTWLLGVARDFLSGFDLDPASDSSAQNAVRATRWCGEYLVQAPTPTLPSHPNGLEYEHWSGRVWLNPPGGKTAKGTSVVPQWWARLHTAYLSGAVAEALFLAFNISALRTTQRVLGALPIYAYPFVVFRDRIHFSTSNPGCVETPSPKVDSALVYLPARGRPLTEFAEAFQEYGYVRL